MKGLFAFAASAGLTLLVLSGNALPGSIPLQVQQTLSAEQRNVIVILRDQMASVPAVRRAMGARASALAVSQRSFISEFPQLRTRKIKSFSTINAFAVTVSAAEETQLSLHPAVQAVVPDKLIRGPVHAPVNTRLNREKMTNAPTKGTTTTTATAATDNGLCNTLEPEALQLANAAFEDPTTPQAQRVVDGKGEFVTGKGVKVAFLADGLDTTVPGFIRPDGSSVFIDYQDFSGDPAGTPTGGGEAYLDASSIAAQDYPKGKLLTYDISQFVNEAHPLPAKCEIHIRGMAPGASLVGLKVFSAGVTTTSDFVQALEYAVSVDDVDVINESFGGEPFPDTANDPISLANDAAVAAGVTVVVSSGDGGTAGTLGSPATDPYVIAAGATTAFRVYSQTGDGVIPLTKSGGYVSDNISALSSGGFAQKSGRTVDVVASGDLDWALCSPNQALYTDCEDDTNAFGPTPIQVSGGTSESSPLTAGTAALVIQAYRSTHHGEDPSPALVKRIIMSTATDLSAPADEQGAGMINALAAVNAALSITDEFGKPKPRGIQLLAAPSSAQIVGQPGHAESQSFIITNEGATPQLLKPTLETLGAPFAGATEYINSNPATDPTFINVYGRTRHYDKKTFKVPDNADHLDAAIAFQNPLSTAGSAPPLVYLALIDPSGRQAAYSIPQGLGSGYAHVDVVKPQAGTWTAVIYTYKTSVANSYTGPVQFTWGVERYVKLGSVHPANLFLNPGESASVTAEFSMPAAPGDLAAAIRFEDSPATLVAVTRPDIPITLRSLVPTGPTGGEFTGTLTGGNSRAATGQYQTFLFDVPKGVSSMNLVLNLSDNGYLLEGMLVDPNGMQLSIGPNQDPLDGSAQYALALSHYNPQPGRWRFLLIQNFYSSGNQTSLPFTARIGFNGAGISAPTLPDSASVQLSASAAPVTIPIQVTNNSPLTKLYFANARLSTYSLLTLPSQNCSAPTLPGGCGFYYLPTQVSTAAFLAQSTVPITMDALNDVGTGVAYSGSPDIYAKTIAPDTVAAFISEPEVPYSGWYVSPSEVGPYGPAGAPTVPLLTSAYVLTQAFDPAVSADSGDIWSDLVFGTNTFNPLTLAPGASGTINVTITPDSSLVGTTVSGHIYVDTFDLNVFTGDEVLSIPYTYSVVP